MVATPRRRLSASARRSRIVAAAGEVFSVKGFETATLEDIAAKAGISRSVVYDHFESKKALFLWLLEHEGTEVLSQVSVALSSEDAPPDRMVRTIEGFLAYVEAHPFAWRTLFRESPSDPDIAAVHRRIWDDSTRALADLLGADARRAGLGAEPAVLELYAQLIVSALKGVATWWFDHPRCPRRQIVMTAMDVLWIGLEGVSLGRSWDPRPLISTAS